MAQKLISARKEVHEGELGNGGSCQALLHAPSRKV